MKKDYRQKNITGKMLLQANIIRGKKCYLDIKYKQQIIAGKDGCQGDSGGPLVAIGEEGETTLTGIVRCFC